MEKKFYEAPELEVLDMGIEGALLAGSDPGYGGATEEPEWG